MMSGEGGRGIDLNSAQCGGGWSCHAPAALLQEEDPEPIAQEARSS